MSGIRIGGTATIPVSPGFPWTAYSLTDFAYVGEADYPNNAIEVTDKLVNTEDEPNNIRLSPNRQWLLWDANFPGPNSEGQIHVISSTAVGGTPLVVSADDPSGNWFLHPSWHPDSDQILFVRGVSGSFQGDVILTSRTNPTVETTIYSNPDPSGATGWGVFRPQFNRDGTKIAWMRHKNAAPADGNNGLYVADSDGSNLTQIDAMGGGAASGYLFEGTQFAWGPNDEIVYVRYVNNTATGAQIYMINADGTGMTQLSTDGATSTQKCRLAWGAWAPDDSYIVGVSNTSMSFGGSWDMWRWELDGSGGTWIDLGIHGPDGSSNFQNVYFHTDGRVYMIESDTGGRLISTLPDGTDIRTDVDLGTNADGDQFYTGTGIEWN